VVAIFGVTEVPVLFGLDFLDFNGWLRRHLTLVIWANRSSVSEWQLISVESHEWECRVSWRIAIGEFLHCQCLIAMAIVTKCGIVDLKIWLENVHNPLFLLFLDALVANSHLYAFCAD